MATSGINLGESAVEATPIGGGEQSVDTSQETTQVQDSGAETRAAEGEQLGDEQTEGTEQIVSGPDKFKGLIESLKKADPGLAKEVKNLVFASEALKKEFPGGLNEIRQLKTTVDDLGGAEGIESIKAEKQEWAQIDDKFAEGDPSVLDTFAKFNPEGFAKLIPAALDKLAGLDKQTYDHALAGIFVSTLDSWKFGDQLERLFDDLSQVVDGQGKQILTGQMSRIQSLYKQYQSMQELASKAPIKKVESEDKKLQQERAEIATERSRMTTEHVARATNDYATAKVESFLTVEAKNQKLNMEALKKTDLGDGKTAFSRMSAEINEEIGRMVAADKQFVQKIRDSIAAGRRDDAVKLSNSKFDQVYQPAVKKVVKLWSMLNPKGSVAKTAATAASGQPAATPGVKKLEKQPDMALIDQTKPDWRNNYMWGKATLKTGQRVEW